jgi:hypothetical protein
MEKPQVTDIVRIEQGRRLYEGEIRCMGYVPNFATCGFRYQVRVNRMWKNGVETTPDVKWKIVRSEELSIYAVGKRPW